MDYFRVVVPWYNLHSHPMQAPPHVLTWPAHSYPLVRHFYPCRQSVIHRAEGAHLVQDITPTTRLYPLTYCTCNLILIHQTEIRISHMLWQNSITKSRIIPMLSVFWRLPSLCKNTYNLCLHGFTPLATPPRCLTTDVAIHGKSVTRDGPCTSLRKQRLSDGLWLRHRHYAEGK